MRARFEEVLPLLVDRRDGWMVRAEREWFCLWRAYGQQWPRPVSAVHQPNVEDAEKSLGWHQQDWSDYHDLEAESSSDTGARLVRFESLAVYITDLGLNFHICKMNITVYTS